ncbi:MAG: DNA primase [Candidatus Omnitrophota bacterium]
MAGRIPDNILDDILSRVNIVEVISGYVPLKKAGRNFKASCPFHHEKTPSFMVSADRQIFHCFGCGESGNAFKFLMRYERLEFLEAVEILAKKAGVELPKTDTRESKAASINTQLYKINELAALHYEQNLKAPAGGKPKDYLLKRDIKEETIKTFRIGLALNRWDALINDLRGKNYSLSLLEKAGLILSKEGGGFYDRFRNRIIFPICDIKSRVVGFGARVLDETLPKYINSPETPIYVKGRNLYGFHLAKDSIRDRDFVVIVEGYFDFIIPYQAGLKNIVASLGTALTSEQARLIKRYTHNVVMVYDADAAGELATLRSLDIFIEEEMNVRIVSLPKGFDPDTYVRKHGIQSLEEKITGACDLFDYKLQVLKSRFNVRKVEDKARIAGSMLETIHKIKNAVLKSEYVRKLAQDLDIREEALLEEIRKISPAKPYAGFSDGVSKKTTQAINPTEQLLIKLMLEENELVEHIRKNLEPADFQDERACRIVSILFDLIGQGKTVDPASLINHLDDELASQVICESMFLPETLSQDQKEAVVADCVRRLKSKKSRLKRELLHGQIKAAQQTGDEEELGRLIEEFDYLIKQR